MKSTKKLGYPSLASSTLVDISNYLSHYLSKILGNSDNYKSFKPVPLENITSKKKNPKELVTYIHTSSTHTTI